MWTSNTVFHNFPKSRKINSSNVKVIKYSLVFNLLLLHCIHLNLDHSESSGWHGKSTGSWGNATFKAGNEEGLKTQPTSTGESQRPRDSTSTCGKGSRSSLQTLSADLKQVFFSAESVERLLHPFWEKKKRTLQHTWFFRLKTNRCSLSLDSVTQKNQRKKSPGLRWHSRSCPEGLCWRARRCLHGHLQHLAEPSCCPEMPQSHHHHPSIKEAISSCNNDYRPMALTPIIMKCFEQLVTHYINLPVLSHWTTYQFAYQSNCSTNYAISTALHSALTHCKPMNNTSEYCSTSDQHSTQSYLSSSSSNMLGLNTSMCKWLQDFLTQKPQTGNPNCSRLIMWYKDNNLHLNVNKTNEL